MKPGASRSQIIRTTENFIRHRGIRAVRMDEIVQTLGISKRTLYEMFTDKTNLITICLKEMSEKQRLRAEEFLQPGNPLQQGCQLLRTYINDLYRMDCDFLMDFTREPEYTALCTENKLFWEQSFIRIFKLAIQDGYLSSSINPTLVAQHLMHTMFRTRMNDHLPHKEHYSLCLLLLRGCATPQGIQWMDHTAAPCA
ncbi:MAG: TetR/AcrR family transcriptional regulator [Alistipes sp.]